MSSGLGFVHQWTNPLTTFRSTGNSLPVLQSGRGRIVSVKALKSAPNSDTIVAADESYGRKEVISVNPRLYDYLLANVREPKVAIFVFSLSGAEAFVTVSGEKLFVSVFQILRELREETATMRGSQMQVLMGLVQ